MNDMSRAQVESLVLFEVLDPKPEVLVIGLGERMRTFLPPDVLEHFKVGALSSVRGAAPRHRTASSSAATMASGRR